MSKQADTARAADRLPPVPPAQGGGRMAAGDRREQIVQVAMKLFSERGFRGTTTKEIAQAAGVSEAIIFRHFATKEELYTAIIDCKSCAGGASGLGQSGVVEMIQCSVGEAMEAKDDRAVFEGIALEMMRHHEHDPQFLRLLLYSALEGHQLAQIFWDRNVRVMYEFLGGYIRERQREGALRDVDPFVVVRCFTGSIIHHSLNNTLWDKDKTRRILNIANEDAARAFTDILLGGIRNPGAAATTTRGRGAATKRTAPAAAQTKKKK
ncbi:MAG TPA: TetR/AcrR family transcriptional regulator [Pyrinomonadaceae bacterium]|nr:TetR/AcrR family transcriptional regulator [Pyrinomonadaceae bacterium]